MEDCVLEVEGAEDEGAEDVEDAEAVEDVADESEDDVVVAFE